MRPNIDEAIVNEFLSGTGTHSNLEHVRYIDVPYWSNEGTVIIRDPDNAIHHKQIPYEPFLWTKEIDFEKYFCWKTMELPLTAYSSETKTVVHNSTAHKVDEINVKFDDICASDTSKGIFSFYLPTLEEREKLYREKKREYNIVEERLTTSYDGAPIERMEKGYVLLFKIKPFPPNPQNPRHVHSSTNPKLKYKSDGRINNISGSYNDLISFFKEGGMDVYEESGVYLEPEKIKSFFEPLKLSQKIFFFLNTITPFKNKKGHIDIFGDFWDASSFNEDVCLEWIKKSDKYKTIIGSYFEETPIQDCEIAFGEIPTDRCDKILYEEKHAYIKDTRNLYVSPSDLNAHNALVFMDGYEELGGDWEAIQKLIREELISVVVAVQNYRPKKIIFDARYEGLWGQHFGAIKDMFLTELGSPHESKSYYCVVDEEGNQIEIGEPEKYVAPKSITKGRLFEYFDLLEMKDFLKDLHADNMLQKIFDPKINYAFLKELFAKKDKFSLHTSKYGRKFIELCEEKNYDVLLHKSGMFQTLPPVTQFMYQTGIRLFRGYEFQDLKRLVFDIETRAQKIHEKNGRAALDPNLGEIFKIGIWGNQGFIKILSAETPEEEKSIIEETYRIIAEQNPDILLGYNSEFFDFPYMEKRLEILGGVAEDRNGIFSSHQYIRELIGGILLDHYPNHYVSQSSFYKKKKGTVKAGGDTKDTNSTLIYGINVMDGIHQTWRLMAINKNIEYAGLKYNITTNKIGKANRVYIKGNDIGKIGKETKEIYFNNENGDWFINEIPVEFEAQPYSEKHIKTDENGVLFYHNNTHLFLYTDDSPDKVIAKCKNAFCINVVDSIGMPLEEDYEESFSSYLEERVAELKKNVKDYERIVVPHKRNALSLKAESPKLYKRFISYLTDFHNGCSDLIQMYSHLEKEKYEKVSGAYIVQRYLEDDLWETDVLFEKYAQSSFMLSKWCHNNFDRTALMGYASIWKVFISCWHYLNTIAVPEYDRFREINGGLIGMVTSGFCENVVKFDYSSLYPALKDAYLPPPTWDISGISDYLLRFFLYTRLEYKGLSKKYDIEGNKELASKYDVLQHPLKIFINSYFGFLGATFVSPYADMISAHFITAGSRQAARHMHRYMKPRGYVTTYMHTDGLNKIFPKEALEREYVGQGHNWLVEKGKTYKGLAADVAEYNDRFFRKGKMGVGIDGVDASCINIAKSNVVHYKQKRNKNGETYFEVDITGGLVKKDTPEYIKNFIDRYTPVLMQGKSEEFINGYYGYIEKIWNHKIKAKYIASKVKLKEIQDYLNTAKVKSAPYELILRNKIDVTSGNYFYWINTGENENDVDYTIEKKRLGYFILDSKNPDLEAILRKKDSTKIRGVVERAKKKGLFVFSKSKTENGLQENVAYLDETYHDVVFHYRDKKIKKEEKLVLEVEIHVEKFNCKHVSVNDYEATVAYNQRKYMAKFNSAVEPLFIVFHPDVREKIIQYEPDGTGAFVKPMLTDNETKLINGIPLKGKEENQQKIENLMSVQPVEKQLWLDTRKDPNWIVTEKKLENDFYWVKGGEYHETPIGGFDCKYNLKGIIGFLSENPIDS